MVVRQALVITLEQYFGAKKHPIEHLANANMLLGQVNLCLYKAEKDGCYDGWIDPDTNSQISGAKGGSGDGGYRTPDSRTGGAGSTHRSARAVDVFDPNRILAQWCVKHKAALVEIGLWCEDFRYTPVWCHFQQIQPKSGKRIYIPYASPPLAPALEGQAPIPFTVK